MGLFGPSWKATRCKAQLQMVVGRKRLQKNKKELANKATKKAVAEMVREGKLDNASIKVEVVLQEEALLRAFELIELYAELLLVRMSLLDKEKVCPEDLREAVASVVFAAPALGDLPELTQVRKDLTAKFTKEWVGEMVPIYLNPDLRELLTIRTPDPAVKFEKLSEIVAEHKVEWDAEAARVKLLGGAVPPPRGGDGGTGAGSVLAEPPQPAAQPQPVPVAVAQQFVPVQQPVAQVQYTYVQGLAPPPQVVLAPPTFATGVVTAPPPTMGVPPAQAPLADASVGTDCLPNPSLVVATEAHAALPAMEQPVAPPAAPGTAQPAAGALPTYPVAAAETAPLLPDVPPPMAPADPPAVAKAVPPTLAEVLDEAKGAGLPELPSAPDLPTKATEEASMMPALPTAVDTPAAAGGTSSAADELDELEARFAALKRG